MYTYLQKFIVIIRHIEMHLLY